MQLRNPIMKMYIRTIHLIYFLFISISASAQVPNTIKKIFPEGTHIYNNLSYANDTIKKHLLDIYIPAKIKEKFPLVVWIHGGAWMSNDKYADMDYMKTTLRRIIEQGYAVASIDYRFSTTAVFPAQIQDCSLALDFLFKQADKYKLDTSNFALMGFSAGGHLASLMALAGNNHVEKFYNGGEDPSYKIKAVVDFYGPSDFLAMAGNADINQTNDPISMLLGASVIKRPDLARIASPTTYIDRNDPPFLIIHGEKDDMVPNAQSRLMKSYLDLVDVKNELIIVKNAPHYGAMFDSEEIRNRIFVFLDTFLK